MQILVNFTRCRRPEEVLKARKTYLHHLIHLRQTLAAQVNAANAVE